MEPISRANAIPLEMAMGPWSQLGPRIKCPMEQLAAPDKKQMGPLNQAPIQPLWIPWAPHWTPEDEQKGPLETSGEHGAQILKSLGPL